jgi:nucleoid-associated protein YgaU
MKTRVALIVLMVVLVAGIVIYDQKFGTSTEPKPPDSGTAIATSGAPAADPFAALAPIDTAPPTGTGAANDPFAMGTPTGTGSGAGTATTSTPPPTTGTSTGISTTPPPSSGTSKPPSDLATTTGTRTKPANPFLDTPPPALNPADTKGVKKGGKEPRPAPASTSPFDTTPPPSDLTALTSGGKTHKVLDGESLWTIAEDYYKDGTKFKAIEEANKDTVGGGKLLKVGMTIVIPELSSSSPSARATPAGSKESVAGPGEYKVKSGDSLATIARDQLGGEGHWELIAKANEDTLAGRPDRLKVGMILRIPEKPAKTEKAAPLPKPGKTPELKEESIPADLAGKRTYRIKSGDSLWIIAEREMRSGVKWEKLYEANRDRLTSKTDLKVGQVIVIPDDAGPSTR